MYAIGGGEVTSPPIIYDVFIIIIFPIITDVEELYDKLEPESKSPYKLLDYRLLDFKLLRKLETKKKVDSLNSF